MVLLVLQTERKREFPVTFAQVELKHKSGANARENSNDSGLAPSAKRQRKF